MLVKRLKVELRQEHLDGGIPRDPGACPVALAVDAAIRRVGSGPPRCSVWTSERGTYYADIERFEAPQNRIVTTTYLLPMDVQEAIGAFDNGRRDMFLAYLPWEFDITVDDGSSVEPPVGMEEG